jgi:hypothetical protein
MKKFLLTAAIAASATFGLGLTTAQADNISVIIVVGNGALQPHIGPARGPLVITIDDRTVTALAGTIRCAEPAQPVNGVYVFYGICDAAAGVRPLILTP